jgi:hypothetical protein
MTNIYLCDIDGTLAHNNGHRNFYDESKVLDDKPLPTINVIKSLIATGERIIYFSGRKEQCREDTIKWLTLYVDDSYPELYMRQNNDNRKDSILKEEMYNTHIKDKYTVLGVFDDRLQVCQMWYNLGLFVFNVNQGLKDF